MLPGPVKRRQHFPLFWGRAEPVAEDMMRNWFNLAYFRNYLLFECQLSGGCTFSHNQLRLYGNSFWFNLSFLAPGLDQFH